MENMDLGQLAGDLFQGFQIDGERLVEAILAGQIGEAVSVFLEAVGNTIGRPTEYLKESI